MHITTARPITWAKGKWTMRNLFKRPSQSAGLLTSSLLDDKTFYAVFLKDLHNCQNEVIIECPFITRRRLSRLLPVFQKLQPRKVRIIINTRDPQTCNDYSRYVEANNAVAALQRIGVRVLYTAGHHRKLAIIDRKVLYEGSLNILSQYCHKMIALK